MLSDDKSVIRRVWVMSRGVGKCERVAAVSDLST